MFTEAFEKESSKKPNSMQKYQQIITTGRLSAPEKKPATIPQKKDGLKGAKKFLKKTMKRMSGQFKKGLGEVI